jgi:hypothetical protein
MADSRTDQLVYAYADIVIKNLENPCLFFAWPIFILVVKLVTSTRFHAADEYDRKDPLDYQMTPHSSHV